MRALRYIVAATHLAALAGSAVPPCRGDEPDEMELAKVRQLIDRVRDEERKYQRLETVVRTLTKVRDHARDGAMVLAAAETRHTVVQDDLLYCRVAPVSMPAALPTPPRGLISAYDGEKTRSVEFGLCANIHLSRWESPQVVPPHSWALMGAGFDFPLSVVLDETAAVQRHPKVKRFVDQRGPAGGIRQVESRIAGEEEVGDLRCIKLVCREWIGGQTSKTYRIWLAPERNYLCVRSQTIVGAAFGAGDESRVTELREIAPGTWLPARITFQQVYGGVREMTLQLEKGVLDPRRPREFFSDVAIPADLPVFTIQRGRLAGPIFRTAVAPESSARRMAELVDLVRANEEKYQNLETQIDRSFRQFQNVPDVALGGSVAPFSAAIDAVERSAARSGKSWYTTTTNTSFSDGRTTSQELTEVSDGDRTVVNWIKDDPANKVRRRTADSRVQTAAEEFLSHRPHMLLDSVRLNAARPFSDRLALVGSRGSDLRVARAEWLAEETRDGHVCDVIRLATVVKGAMSDEAAKDRAEVRFQDARVIWLARDRNYLPIRQESYGLAWSAELPASVATLTNLREIAPGVWYPFQRSFLGFEATGPATSDDARLVVRYRYDDRVKKAALDPEVPPAWFRSLPVDAGTME